MDERELIEQITREVILRLQSAGVTLSPAKPSATPLVILAGRFGEMSAAQEVLTALARTQVDFRIFSGESDFSPVVLPVQLTSKLVRGSTESELEELLMTSTHLALPWISLAVLSRLVNLQPECPVSLILTKALMKGVAVRIRQVLTEPYVNLYEPQEISPVLRRIRRLVTEGKQLGINWMPGTAVAELVKIAPEFTPAPGKALLTAADVQRMRDTGSLTVPAGTIITPLAKDELRRLGLRVQQNEGRGVVK